MSREHISAVVSWSAIARAGCCLAIVAACAAPRTAAHAAPHADDRTWMTRYLCGHTDAVHAVKFFPDGKRIVSGSADRTLRVWDVETGRPLMTLAGHEGPIWTVDVSPDGKFIASAGDDLVARVWDAQSGAIVAQLAGHTRTIRGIGFLPNNRLITGAARGDGTVRVWDIATERELFRIDADDCVLAMDLSADRTRVAFGGCDGAVKVWDLVARKRLVKFVLEPRARIPVVTLTLSPDGRRVYVGRDISIAAYDVAADAWAPLPYKVPQVSQFAASADGKRIVTTGGAVVDGLTGEPLHTLAGARGDRGEANCAAFSRDGLRVAMGTGGTPVNEWEWRPGIVNQVLIYDLPRPSAAGPSARPPAGAPAGAPDGVVSWQAIPARVREADNKLVPFGSSPRYTSTVGFGQHWQACSSADGGTRGRPGNPAAGPPVDLLYFHEFVFLHREPGILDVVAADPQINWSDAAWDGAHFWIGSATAGLRAIDARGRVAATVGAAEGLPLPCEERLVLHALDRDRILVAGSNSPGHNDGWCAVVERAAAPGAGAAAGEPRGAPAPGASPYRARVLFRETEIPHGWREAFRRDRPDDTAPSFRPLLMSERPAGAADQPREVWIFCQAVPRSSQPVVRVDAATLAFDSFNLTPNSDENVYPENGVSPFRNEETSPPAWLTAAAYLGGYSGTFWVARVTANQPYIDSHTAPFAFDVHTSDRHTPVPLGGQLYVPAPQWLAIDPATARIRRLGPGPAGSSDGTRNATVYFASAHWGLAAFAPDDGNLYRISVDPAHPLPQRPRILPPAPLPVIAEPGLTEWGLAEHGPDTVTFRAGLGDLTFRTGKLITDPSFRGGTHLAVMAVERARGIPIGHVDGLVEQLNAHPSERQRIGVTDAQWAALKPLRAPQPQLRYNGVEPKPPLFPAADRERIEALFAAFQAAPDDRARTAAAVPLFAEVKMIGKGWEKEAADHLTATLGALTETQWATMQYQSAD